MRAIPPPEAGRAKFCDRNEFLGASSRACRGWAISSGARSPKTPRTRRKVEALVKGGSEELALSDAILDDAKNRILTAVRNGDQEEARFLTDAFFGEFEAAGPLAKNIGPERTEALRRQLHLKAGDAAFFLAGKPHEFDRRRGAGARDEIGRELGLIDERPLRLRLDRGLPDVREG